jgi:hypothetical protein
VYLFTVLGWLFASITEAVATGPEQYAYTVEVYGTVTAKLVAGAPNQDFEVLDMSTSRTSPDVTLFGPADVLIFRISLLMR